jgi:endonuclease-8
VAEGDTVHATADRLRGRFEGRVLQRTELRVPRFATADLSGRLVSAVVARGKHLLLRTDRGETIHSHLGMDGSWDLVEGVGRRFGPASDVRAVLEAEGWSAIGRRLRRLDVLDTRREGEAIGDLGPDPLGLDWNAEDALRRLTADPERPVGEALLDQSVIAGPGNVYRSEACFLVGVDPRSPVASVPDPVEVVETIRRLMVANRGGGRRSTTGDRRPGRELWVYGRARLPCRRCGTPIARIAIGVPPRLAFVCPSCQPPTG